jgi:hypothetical protein
VKTLDFSKMGFGLRWLPQCAIGKTDCQSHEQEAGYKHGPRALQAPRPKQRTPLTRKHPFPFQ